MHCKVSLLPPQHRCIEVMVQIRREAMNILDMQLLITSNTFPSHLWVLEKVNKKE